METQCREEAALAGTSLRGKQHMRERSWHLVLQAVSHALLLPLFFPTYPTPFLKYKKKEKGKEKGTRKLLFFVFGKVLSVI